MSATTIRKAIWQQRDTLTKMKRASVYNNYKTTYLAYSLISKVPTKANIAYNNGSLNIRSRIVPLNTN
jgi:hypothetical protein